MLGWLKARRESMLGDLRRLVERESPTGDVEPLERTARWLAEWFSPLGSVELVRCHADSAPHLLIEIGQWVEGTSPLVLCHYDTVWSRGTVARWPFSVRGGWAAGPGALDMKASIVLVHYAHRALRGRGARLTQGVRVLMSADEELGNPTSRGLIEDLARGAGMAFVMEPPLPDGRLKTSRKGHARIRVDVEGRAAHAGIEPEKGINAAVEAARAALVADGLNDAGAETTVTVGVLRGGERANIVPATAEIEIDVRAMSPAELDRVVRALAGLSSTRPGTGFRVNVETRREPMPRLLATEPLLASARRVGAALGIAIEEGHTGGVSEGNLTQACGTPTLDGLGVVGLGPHTPAERIVVSSLVERAALHAGMLWDLSS